MAVRIKTADGSVVTCTDKDTNDVSKAITNGDEVICCTAEPGSLPVDPNETINPFEGIRVCVAVDKIVFWWESVVKNGEGDGESQDYSSQKSS